MDLKHSENAEYAMAAALFNQFCGATTMKSILALYRQMCEVLNLKPSRFTEFYPKIKTKLSSSWKAQALYKKFDIRANHKVYGRGKACMKGKVLIIGGGPCGLRAAIECQLLGAKVVVVEKRDRMSRNNVLHLWPFLIHDLRALGAKKFYGKFCAGSLDHISIRQLQCILLKVALLIGVEFHENVTFEALLEPTITPNYESLGWRAKVTPADHPVSQYEYDSLIGADGKRNTLADFKRKEFRGKLAIAITANFINRHTDVEAAVPEISGIAFIFKQKFFKELNDATGIDLENIVYYKDDTHYFVMTAKKQSLLDKGVILQDYADVANLLATENVDRNALMKYAYEAARFSTNYRIPLNDFALNHYGLPDVALFDFTSMYAAENASLVKEVNGHKILCQLVGDSLLEPFWPTGSGCARGFLSAMDAAWAIRSWCQSPAPHPLDVVAERESIYRLLAQTTPDNLHRNISRYTLDPSTRYPRLNARSVVPIRVVSLYISDDPIPMGTPSSVKKRKRVSDMSITEGALLAWVGVNPEAGLREAASPSALASLVRKYRPDLLPSDSPDSSVYDILHKECGISPIGRDVTDSRIRSYLMKVYNSFKGEVPHVKRDLDVFQISVREKTPSKTLSTPVSSEERKHESGRKSRRRKPSRSTPVGTLDSQAPPKCHVSTLKRAYSLKKRESFNKKKLELLSEQKRDVMMPRHKSYIRTNVQDLVTKFMAKPIFTENESSVNIMDDDEGIKQYRSSGVEFGQRIQTLERQLLQSDEAHLVGQAKHTSSGAKVAKLAANLSSAGVKSDLPKLAKPKDLMRSVGKINKEDWNVKLIENKIMENRLGRPSPKAAEKVPKWNREQFLGRKQRLTEKDVNEKWGEIDHTLQKLDQRLRDSGRPDQGTEKVAKLATMFLSKDKEGYIPQDKNVSTSIQEQNKKSWKGASTSGIQCAACGTTVFAAESVIADGLHLHRACFRCAVCKAVLRPGNYQVERYGSRLICLRHSSVNVPDAVGGVPTMGTLQQFLRDTERENSYNMVRTPERITFEASTLEAKEIDEDEWTDRNFPLSESSVAAGQSDDEDGTSSSDDDFGSASSGSETAGNAEAAASDDNIPLPYRRNSDSDLSDDTFGYDDVSDDSGESTDGESSDAESCSRMRAALEARRREVPTEARPPTDSSEVDSEEQESEEETSSATEVSTDSEFANEESTPLAPPPVITVTEVMPTYVPTTPPVTKMVTNIPLSRAMSSSGLATKRALELKRKYLLGEPSPPTVRRSDSTSRLDTKLEAIQSTISEFQKLLHPATSEQQATSKDTAIFQPRDIKPNSNLIMDMLNRIKEPPHVDCIPETIQKTPGNKIIQEIESDSLTEESLLTQTAQKPVPRVEIHDEGGELIQSDSLILITDNGDEKDAQSITEPTALIPNSSDSSLSCKEIPTVALTETEFSDWTTDIIVLDESILEEDKRNKNPRSLSKLKLVHEAKNLNAISTHVCGRHSPSEPVMFLNAADHFEFADEGDEDPSLENVSITRNDGYMEIIDDHNYNVVDRSMNYIEQKIAETMEIDPLYISDEVKTTIDSRNSISLDSSTKTSIASSISPSVGTLNKEAPLPRSVESPFNVPCNISDSSLRNENLFSPVGVKNDSSCVLPTPPSHNKVEEMKKRREEETELVRSLVLERLGKTPKKICRKSRIPVTNSPSCHALFMTAPTAQTVSSNSSPSTSSPSISIPSTGPTQDRSKGFTSKFFTNIMQRNPSKSTSSSTEASLSRNSSAGTLDSLEAPPVPPLPVKYQALHDSSFENTTPRNLMEVYERDVMQLWFEARWARLIASRPKRRDMQRSHNDAISRRLAHIERRLSRPLNAEQEAAAVAELVQVSAKRDAHLAMFDANKKRTGQ